MAKSKRQPEAEGTNDRELAESVHHLADEVEVLRNAIDELREIFTWAVRADRLRGGTDAPPVVEPPPARVLELDEHQLDAMSNAITESVHDLAADVEGAVRDGIKEQIAEFRDSVDQFSIDVQHVARKTHQKPAEELAALQETLQGEIVDLRGSLEQFMIEVHDAIGQIHSPVKPVDEPAAIVESASLIPDQPLRCFECPQQDEEAAHELISRTVITGSAAIAHTAQAQCEVPPPLQGERQSSLF